MSTPRVTHTPSAKSQLSETSASSPSALLDTEPQPQQKAPDLLVREAPGFDKQKIVMVWPEALSAPQVGTRDDDLRGAGARNSAAFGDALTALLAEHRTQASASESRISAPATEFVKQLEAVYLSAMGQSLLGSLLPGEMSWPVGFEGLGIGLFSPEGDARLNLRALSLANPPLRVPLVVVTHIDPRAEDALTRLGLPRGQAFQVVGTYRDAEGAPHLLLGRADPLSGLEHHFSVPTALLSEILSHIIIGDARIERALRDAETAQAKLPADRACCRHITASAGVSKTPRVAESTFSRRGERCWICPYAHDLCQPGGNP